MSIHYSNMSVSVAHYEYFMNLDKKKKTKKNKSILIQRIKYSVLFFKLKYNLNQKQNIIVRIEKGFFNTLSTTVTIIENIKI